MPAATARRVLIGVPFATCLLWMLASIMIDLARTYDQVALPITMIVVYLGYWPCVIAWMSVPVASSILAVWCLGCGRWYRAAGWSIVPLAAVIVVLWGGVIAEGLRFALNRGAYERDIADARARRCPGAACNSPLVLVFTWGGLGSLWFGVVYDSTDEIAKSPPSRSKTWQPGDASEPLEDAVAYRRLGDHYYLVSGS